MAAVGALVDAHPDLIDVLEEHLRDNEGEVLAHLVMADVIRWMVAHRLTHPETCRSILDWMEDRVAGDVQDVRDLVLVSGVDIIPSPGKPGAELRDLLGPGLRAADTWL